MKTSEKVLIEKDGRQMETTGIAFASVYQFSGWQKVNVKGRVGITPADGETQSEQSDLEHGSQTTQALGSGSSKRRRTRRGNQENNS